MQVKQKTLTVSECVENVEKGVKEVQTRLWNYLFGMCLEEPFDFSRAAFERLLGAQSRFDRAAMSLHYLAACLSCHEEWGKSYALEDLYEAVVTLSIDYGTLSTRLKSIATDVISYTSTGRYGCVAGQYLGVQPDGRAGFGPDFMNPQDKGVIMGEKIIAWVAESKPEMKIA